MPGIVLGLAVGTTAGAVLGVTLGAALGVAVGVAFGAELEPAPVPVSRAKPDRSTEAALRPSGGGSVVGGTQLASPAAIFGLYWQGVHRSSEAGTSVKPGSVHIAGPGPELQTTTTVEPAGC